MAGKKKAAAPGEIGHNSGASTPLTDDEMHALTLQHKKKYEHALAAKKTADANFKNACKLAKAELGDTAILDIKDMIAAEADGFDEKFQAELERQARMARWLGLSLGDTADLFGESSGTQPPLADRAFDEGKRAGLAGEQCKPSYGEGGEAYQKYVEGWHVGQAALAGQIKKKETAEVPLIVNEERHQSGVDEFDEAAGGDDEASEESEWPDDEQISARTGDNAEREPAETL